jgi:hypothetical protein
MALLSDKDRAKLADSDFAYIDSNGDRHLPIHDPPHVRVALARFNQTQFESPAAKAAAAKKIVAAAKKFGIEVDPTSPVAKAAGLRSKARWTQDQRRGARQGGIERRGTYAGRPETRLFKTGLLTPVPVVRSGNGASPASVTVTGNACVYGVPYSVTDQFGRFTETVAPHAANGCLGDDVRFLFDHGGLPLSRTRSGTLKLTDTDAALQVLAELDPQITVASDLIRAMARGDVNQMSIGFCVAPDGDDWNSTFTTRVINRFQTLFDVSAVSMPASPTTPIAVAEDRGDASDCDCSCALCATDNTTQHCLNCDYGGEQGDQMANDPSPLRAGRDRLPLRPPAGPRARRSRT